MRFSIPFIAAVVAFAAAAPVYEPVEARDVEARDALGQKPWKRVKPSNIPWKRGGCTSGDRSRATCLDEREALEQDVNPERTAWKREALDSTPEADRAAWKREALDENVDPERTAWKRADTERTAWKREALDQEPWKRLEQLD